MLQGLYAAANGMIAVEDRQAAIANNIANASTPGFKRQLAVQEGFYQVFAQAGEGFTRLSQESNPGGGIRLSQTYSDYSDGVVMNTGRPLDIALVGPGMMEVETPFGPRYTRSGKLSAGSDGSLVTDHGYRVMGAEGDPIIVSGGIPQIERNGAISVNGQQRGQIKLMEFSDLHELNRSGYSLYTAPQDVLDRAKPAEDTVVLGQAIESSNVQLPTEISHMMLALRAYEANRKVLSSADETVGRMIDQVGAPG